MLPRDAPSAHTIGITILQDPKRHKVLGISTEQKGLCPLCCADAVTMTDLHVTLMHLLLH